MRRTPPLFVLFGILSSLAPLTALAAPPTVVYLLLDTTRGDRVPALTPTLDRLAADGIRFARHYANSHATRPSMPQLMSGRYYHQNVLREFTPDEHPREFPFSKPDPTAILLPDLLRRSGWQLLGVSAHPWVTADSAFGRPFDSLELLPAPPREGHADAARVVDAGIAAWKRRDPSRPLFLYLHFMDAHMPRFLRPGETLDLGDGERFRDDGEPAFDRRRRRWDRADATDFTPLDVRWFTAVYDQRVRYMDAQIGRLLDALRAADPGLANTLVVVTADHGEELGEDGRTDHTDSLAEAVQHVPWIMSGAGIAGGQVARRYTEHVDVMPTLLARLGVALPAGVHTDGRAQLAGDGRQCDACGKTAVYYAWEEYRAVRTGRRLLREERPADGLRARCEGPRHVYDVSPDRLVVLVDDGRAPRLGAALASRLDERERTFLATRYGTPARSFVMRSPFWSVGEMPGCARIGAETTRADLSATGWTWTGRGATILRGESTLPVTLAIPDQEYGVDVAVVPIASMPWLFGFERWLRKSFLPDAATAWIPLGTHRAIDGRLRLALPPSAGTGNHVLGLRLTPPGAEPGAGAPTQDPAMRERLKALGYVQ